MAVTDKRARTESSGDNAPGSRRSPLSMRRLRDGQAFVRNRIAGAVWLVAALCAAVLAIGALLVALEANPANSVVQWFSDAADTLAGPLGEIFIFERDNGSPDEAKNALVNWGIAAVAYLVVGKLVQRLVKA